jgi:hypothetical protein
MVHSFADHPLRPEAIMAIVAFSCALCEQMVFRSAAQRGSSSSLYHARQDAETCRDDDLGHPQQKDPRHRVAMIFASTMLDQACES